MQKSQRLRPVDLAREHGLSTQAIRNYEAAGVLPPAERTPHGYRTYTELHAQALRTFLKLMIGHGHQASASIMCAVHAGTVNVALRILDEGHAQLLEDRTTLRAVDKALADLASGVPERLTRGGMFIGPLAHKLGIEPATLRKWERAGLLRPYRDPETGYRVYTENDVRDAQMTRQLRRGGYLLDQIEPVITQIRTAGGVEQLGTLMAQWQDRLSARGRAMLGGAAELDTYLRALETEPNPPVSSQRSRAPQSSPRHR